MVHGITLKVRNNNRHSIMPSDLTMGEVTTLAKNSPKFASLRTTIPMNIVRQWQLKEGSKLDWSWEVINGEMVIVVRKTSKK
jgi:hypothetical protein